ncbi:MAG: hypothetical protein EPO10_26505 [Reyranella sp.]|uniref:hypothetical protein n=1 Tax=Reyranella sp. TaxID=1929291 RepID=UPI00121FEE34|nr:hypothetical protein [Reyranella sp.]TAJ97129.1 MAG: hypothetical protein EPO41_03820 [Reyranella sp.]TBR23767.1 MAG: hypothetical protein EPO10_26505 [Reyranella sp.]
MQEITDNRDGIGGTFRVEKDEDGDLSVIANGKFDGERASVWLNPAAARQLYNAIGAEMGFDKPAKTRTAPKGAQAYKGNGNHKWEEVTTDPKGAGYTYRLRVPGGWLYRTVTTVPGYLGEEPIPVAQSTVFVPVSDVVGYAV